MAKAHFSFSSTPTHFAMGFALTGNNNMCDKSRASLPERAADQYQGNYGAGYVPERSVEEARSGFALRQPFGEQNTAVAQRSAVAVKPEKLVFASWERPHWPANDHETQGDTDGIYGTEAHRHGAVGVYHFPTVPRPSDKRRLDPAIKFSRAVRARTERPVSERAAAPPEGCGPPRDFAVAAGGTGGERGAPHEPSVPEYCSSIPETSQMIDESACEGTGSATKSPRKAVRAENGGSPCSARSEGPPKSGEAVVATAASERPMKNSQPNAAPANKGKAGREQKERKWTTMLSALREYKSEHGDCVVPRDYDHEYKLASWILEQRKQFRLRWLGRHSNLTDERVLLLEELDFVWNVQEAAWARNFEDLEEYRKEYSDCLVPFSCVEYPKLGIWVKEQRRHYALLQDGKPSHMTPERIRKLESLGFDWDYYEAVWQKLYGELFQYRGVHSNCQVPSKYLQNPKLGSWVNEQRRQYKLLKEGKATCMTEARMKSLESIGFKWTTKAVKSGQPSAV